VIGGVFVRDPNLGAISGRYLFGDYARTELRTLSIDAPDGDPKLTGVSVNGAYSLYSFGADARGCVYVMADDRAYRLASATSDSPSCPLPLPSEPADSVALRGEIKILSRSIRASTKGKLRLRIQNSGALACTGSLSINSARKLRLRRGDKRTTIAFSKARYKSLASGKTRTMVLHVRGAKRTLLTRRVNVGVVFRAACESTGVPLQVTKKNGSLLRAKRR
jgi:hypothetical protein